MFFTRAEEKPQIGSGHLTRSIRLSKFLESKGFHSELLIKRSGFATQILRDADIRYHFWDAFDFSQLKSFDVVVVDDYSPSLRYLEKIKANRPQRIVGIDILSRFSYFDVCINPIFPSPEADYCGLRYSLHQVHTRAPLKSSVGRVFLSFGRYDYRNLMQRSLDIIDEELKDAEVCAFPRPNRSLKNNRLMDGLTFNDALASSDVAIVSGGLTLFDTVHAGVPSIAWCQYRHQIHNADLFQDCVLNARQTNDEHLIGDYLRRLVQSFPLRKRMQERCYAALDDKGPDRVHEIIVDGLSAR